MRTDLIVPNAEYRPFEYILDPRIEEITISTDSEGPLTLKDYIVHPTFRHQAVMMAHEGKVVYEAIPGCCRRGSTCGRRHRKQSLAC